MDQALPVLASRGHARRRRGVPGTAQTFAETEPITDVGARLGWTVVSMARDWDVVFAPADNARHG